MRDLFFVAFLAGVMLLALRRPFIFTLLYCYVDIVAPQRLAFTLLANVQLSLFAFALAIAGFMIADNKKGMRFDWLQMVLIALFGYCWITTTYADFPVEAADKWSWVWKALLWSIFLPLALRTRLRIEALVFVMVISAAALAISGGMKTALGGSGYGSLQLLLDDNSGLFEGSTFSTVAIAIIPLILWLAKYGTLFPTSRYVWAFAIALVGACLLIPIGTQTRTGLLCIVLIGAFGLRDSEKRMTYIGGIVAAGLLALPLVPAAFAARMDTIANYQSDESASTRIAVWKWTWDFALEHPFGGGFDSYRQNELQAVRVTVTNNGGQVTRTETPYTDKARAFHNSYFEMLGEQGFPGLALWLLIQITGIMRMEKLRRRYKLPEAGNEWVRPLATALQGGHLVYLLGSMFVAIAFQPFVYMLIATEIGLWTYMQRREQEARWRPITGQLGLQPGAPAGQGAIGQSATGHAPMAWRGG